jgi:hypothetical protein
MPAVCPFGFVGNFAAGGGPVEVKSTLAAIFALPAPANNQRAILFADQQFFGVWRYSTYFAAWVPDGTIYLKNGSDAIFGAGTDQWPSTNGGSGSVAYTWDANGLSFGAASPGSNQTALWGWTLCSSSIPWTKIAKAQMTIFTRYTTAGSWVGYLGGGIGDYKDVGALRDAVWARVPSNDNTADVWIGTATQTWAANWGGTSGADLRLGIDYSSGSGGAAVQSNFTLPNDGAANNMPLSASQAAANHDTQSLSEIQLAFVQPVSGASAWTSHTEAVQIQLQEAA